MCHWCETCLGVQIVEDEKHVIFDCDLYADLRSKLICALNSSCHLDGTAKLTIDHSTLKSNLMRLLSPNTVLEISPNIIDQFNQHHTNLSLKLNTSAYTSLLEARSLIINSVCSFIYRCLDKRWKYLKDVCVRKSDARNLKTIVISITR